jgi:DUF3093 family protein
MPDAPGGAPLPAPSPDALPTAEPASVLYSERLTLGPLGWVLLTAFALMIGIAFVPVDVRLAVVLAVAALGAGVAVLVSTAPVVRVDGSTFRAGTAAIPVELLGSAVALDATEARAELGPRLDARAYLCLRGWIHTAVRVELRDPQDPTPYWIVSTRRPTALVGALADARTPR